MIDAACPGCGVANAEGARFCRGCGVAAGAASAAASPRTAKPAGLRGVAAVFLAFVSVTIAETIASRLGIPGPVLNLASAIATVAIAVIVLLAAGGELAPLLTTTGGWRGGGAAVLGFGALLAFGAIYFGALDLLRFPTLRLTDGYRELGWPIGAAYALNALAPAVTEEITLRGYVMARLAPVLSANEVLLVQAALFSVLHFSPAIFPSHFVIGLVLGVLRQRTGSLYPGMAVHAAWNARALWLELAG